MLLPSKEYTLIGISVFNGIYFFLPMSSFILGMHFWLERKVYEEGESLAIQRPRQLEIIIIFKCIDKF